MQKNTYPFLTLSIFIMGIVGCGLLSVGLGKELQWDLAAYHFYNPYAFLQHRYQQDYWPASALQMFLSPSLDFISYFFITHLTPRQTEFCLGALHGINIGLLFCIARSLLRHYCRDALTLTALTLFAVLFGIYAPTVLSGIGAFFNDNLVAVFILGYVCYWISLLQHEKMSAKQVVAANLLLGIALGCKLTSGIYLVGALTSSLLVAPKAWPRFKCLAYSIVGIVIGLILSDGYWLWHLWQQYQSPFFPFYNKIFHAPNFPLLNWQDKRFLPENWLQWIFFPFYFSTWRKATTELYCADYRFIFVYVLLVGLLIKQVLQKSEKRPASQTWFYLFCIFSYLAWEWNFSILRYMGVLQMFAPTLILLLTFDLFQSHFIRGMLAASLFTCILMTMHPMGIERMSNFGTSYFNVQIPPELQTIQQATVLMPFSELTLRDRPNPNQYLIPFLPTSWRFAGVAFNRDGYAVTPELKNFVRQSKGKIYVLAASTDMSNIYAAAQDLNLHAMNTCSEITSDRQRLSKEQIFLCEVQANN